MSTMMIVQRCPEGLAEREYRYGFTEVQGPPEEWGREREAAPAAKQNLGWEKPIAIGFAECLWSGRLTGYHFLGRAFIDDSSVFQPTKS